MFSYYFDFLYLKCVVYITYGKIHVLFLLFFSSVTDVQNLINTTVVKIQYCYIMPPYQIPLFYPFVFKLLFLLLSSHLLEVSIHLC